MTVDERPPVDDDQLKRWLRPGLAFVATVLVALFVQKSDGNSAWSTLLYLLMAASGTFLTILSVIGFRFWKYRHINRLSWALSRTSIVIGAGVVGLLLIASSLMGIDKEDSVVGPELGSGESVKDSNSIALRNFQAVQNEDAIRIAVTLINKRKNATTVDTVEIGYIRDRSNVHCYIPADAPPFYTVKDTVKFEDGGTGLATVEPRTGPFAGYPILAQGTLVFGCGSARFKIVFPVTINLSSQGSTTLTIELPRNIYTEPAPPRGGGVARPPEHVQLYIPEPDDNPSSSSSMFVRLGYGAHDEMASINQQIDG